jgi:hypothetical protein
MVENVAKPKPLADGRQMIAQVRGPLSVDEQGDVLGVDGKRYRVSLRGTAPGETYVLRLFATGKEKIESSVPVTPIPIEANDGNCHAQAILSGTGGIEYEILGKGFPSKSEIGFERSFEGKVQTKKIEAREDGTWRMKVDAIGSRKIGADFAVTFSGQSCRLVLNLPWRPST